VHSTVSSPDETGMVDFVDKDLDNALNKFAKNLDEVVRVDGEKKKDLQLKLTELLTYTETETIQFFPYLLGIDEKKALEKLPALLINLEKVRDKILTMMSELKERSKNAQNVLGQALKIAEDINIPLIRSAAANLCRNKKSKSNPVNFKKFLNRRENHWNCYQKIKSTKGSLLGNYDIMIHGMEVTADMLRFMDVEISKRRNALYTYNDYNVCSSAYYVDGKTFLKETGLLLGGMLTNIQHLSASFESLIIPVGMLTSIRNLSASIDSLIIPVMGKVTMDVISPDASSIEPSGIIWNHHVDRWNVSIDNDSMEIIAENNAATDITPPVFPNKYATPFELKGYNANIFKPDLGGVQAHETRNYHRYSTNQDDLG
jgi:hypothetical protein